MFYTDTSFFLGRIVLQKDGVRNHDASTKSVHSQIIPDAKKLNSHCVVSPRYELSFEVLAKMCFILVNSLYRNENRFDFQFYFTSVWKSKRPSKLL